MNLTNSLAIVIQEDQDIQEAQSYFQKEYPGIEYLKEYDSYFYRNMEFDYYKLS